MGHLPLPRPITPRPRWRLELLRVSVSGEFSFPRPLLLSLSALVISLRPCIALSLSIRVIGGSIGYAIYYNIFVNKITSKFPAYIALYAVEAGLPITSAKTFVELYLTARQELATAPIPGLTAVVVQAAGVGTKWAYAESLKYVWYTSIAFGGISIIACIFLGDISKHS